MRLIDADEYAKEMKRRQDAASASIEHPIADRYYTVKEHWEGVMLAFVEAKLTLDKMPTVEKHGRWQWISSTYDRIPCEMRYRCDKCHHETITHEHEPWEKYCPNCGAKMDLEG